MRLINIHTLELHEFIADVPPYAILSHRWSDDEISYKDYRKNRRQDSGGYHKVLRFCKWLQGRAFPRQPVTEDETPNGSCTLDWAWIDTCCIDKRSSAELSEAINSMFTWYACAHICIAFLQDVDEKGDRPVTSSDWWARGWTLQELLAPEIVIFVDSSWQVIGHKCNLDQWQWCMCQNNDPSATFMPSINLAIASMTGIHDGYLRGGATAVRSSDTAAAVKMSWAANRKTTRPEDLAYCLLGIFKVNMPLLYGEGRTAAFRRLQMQILDRDNDQSLFAFESRSDIPQYPLLADDPSSFSNSRLDRHTRRLTLPIQFKQSMLCIETNVQRSLHVRLPDGREILIIRLNCLTNGNAQGELFGESDLDYELALALHQFEHQFRQRHGGMLSSGVTVHYKVNVQESLHDERPLHQIIPVDEREECGRQLLYIRAF